MLIRRAFYYWQFIAAFALPAWLLLGWSIFGGGGWRLLGLLIVCPILTLVMLTVAAIMSLRKAVRVGHALSWLDVGILTLWHAAIVIAGLYGPAMGVFEFFTIATGIAAFWISLWELVTETRNRVSGVMAEFGALAAEPDVAPRPRYDRHHPQDGQTIRLD